MAEIYLFGDSITWGSWDPERGGWAQQLRVEIDRMQLQQPDLWCPVYNLGIPGETASGLSKRIQGELSARHDPSQDVVIIIAVRINDSIMDIPSGHGVTTPEEFMDSLSAIYAIASRFTEKIGFVGLTPIDESLVNPVPWNPTRAYTLHRAELFDSAIAEFCTSRNLPFVALWADWCATSWRSLLHDGLHPNSEGHRKIYHHVRSLVFDRFKL